MMSGIVPTFRGSELSGSELSGSVSEFIPASHEAELRRLRQSNKDLKKAAAGMKKHKRWMEKHALTLQKRNNELEVENEELKEWVDKRREICAQRGLELHRQKDELEVLKIECERTRKLAEERKIAWQSINVSYMKLQGEAMRSTREAKEGRDRIDRQKTCVENLRTTINNQDRLILERQREKEKWQRTSLRLDWLIREMDKVGAIRLPDHEWATDMRHDIEYPDDDGVSRGRSIYDDITRDLKIDCLPNYNDAHMEVVSEEEEIRRYGEWSQEARTYSEVESLSNLLGRLGSEVAVDATTNIQRIWRGFRCRQLQSKVMTAIYIQRIWRGFSSRGIRYYEEPFSIIPSNRFTLRDSLRLINTSSNYTYEIIYLRDNILAATIAKNSYEKIVIETYAKDQWKVRCVQTGKERYFRVPIKGDRGIGSVCYVFDVETGISLEYTHQVHNMLDDRLEWYTAGWGLRVGIEEIPFYALKIKKIDGWIRIGCFDIKKEDELDEDFTHGMFEGEEEEQYDYSLEYLEFHWKELYRKHYNLGWRDPIPGPITLSYEDYVSLSRGTN